MEGNSEETSMDIFTQDGVLLKGCSSFYIHYLNCTGKLYITEYLNSNRKQYLEWKPNEPMIDSEIQDQEWAVVDTVERNLTINQPYEAKSRFIKIDMKDIKSFKATRKNDRLYFYDGKGEMICHFFFQHGNCANLMSVLKGLLRPTASRRDKFLFVVMDELSTETRQLDRSFAELNLFPDSMENNIWSMVRNLQQKPYETTMEAFSKIADIVITSPQERPIDEDTEEILNRSLTTLENASSAGGRTSDEYEVINHSPKLPTRLDYPRGDPVNIEQWANLQGHDGKIDDIEVTKLHIFRGGLVPVLRRKVWKYLLDYFPWDSTQAERQILLKEKCEEYYVMKRQWKTMTKLQEENFADYRERKSLIEKDVNRTDRTIEFYAGDNNPNLQTLYEILMTYVMYNFDLGYVQGMSDLLSPILHLLNNEVDAFWCFVGFMNKLSSNFDEDQASMKDQLESLHTLLAFADPQLANYIDRHDSGNMFFCFRWLLVWFKREMSQDDIMRLWEVLWTGLPCQNFHLLICVAILQKEKSVLMDNNYGFTEILKHINDLSGHLDVDEMINLAEGIFNQIKSASHLTEPVRKIIGLPNVCNNSESSPNDSIDSIERCAFEMPHLGDTEAAYERSLNSSFL